VTEAWPQTWRTGFHQDSASVPKWVLVPVALGLALMPLLKPGGPGNSSPVDILIALAIGATFVWAAVGRKNLHFPYTVAVGVMIAAGALAGLLGAFPVLSLTQLLQDLALFLWCTVIVNASTTIAGMRTLLQTWCWSGLGWATFLVTAYVSGHQDLAGVTAREGARASLTFGDPNLASSYFLVTLILLWAARCPANLWLRAVGSALLLMAMGLTASNGAFLSLIAGAGVGAIFWLYRRHGAAVAIVASCACILLAFAAAPTVQLAEVRALAENSGQPLLRDSLGRSDQSLAQRLTIFSEISDLHAEGALLGWGPRATKDVLQAEQAAYPKEAHNDYIASFVERGPLGSVGLLLLVASLTWRISRILSRDAAAGLSGAGLSQAPMLAAAVAVAVEASHEQVLHFRHVWALFAVIAAASLWYSARQSVPAPREVQGAPTLPVPMRP
jgi:hypothetical protein